MAIHVPILEYHDLSHKTDSTKSFHSPYILNVQDFYNQMQWLHSTGYTTLTLDQLLTGRLDDKSIVLTFDDGHLSNYELAYPILKTFRLSATFLIVWERVGTNDYLQKKNIIEMYHDGMGFGSHSLTHTNLLSLSDTELYKELVQSRTEISHLLKHDVCHFSIPYGFYNRRILTFVEHAGYNTAITENFGYYKPNRAAFKVLPRFTVKTDLPIRQFMDIITRRKARLILRYCSEGILRNLKLLLGYRNYIRLKSIFLNRLSD